MVTGRDGQRTIPATRLFVGALSTHWARTKSSSRCACRRGDRPSGPSRNSPAGAETFALAGVALFYDNGKDGQAADVHVGAIGVGDTPLRLSAVEAAIEGKVVTETIIRDAGVRLPAKASIRQMTSTRPVTTAARLGRCFD